MSESSEKTDYAKRNDKRGILRLDINKPRNSSGSVEFRNPPQLISEVKKNKINKNIFAKICCSFGTAVFVIIKQEKERKMWWNSKLFNMLHLRIRNEIRWLWDNIEYNKKNQMLNEITFPD